MAVYVRSSSTDPPFFGPPGWTPLTATGMPEGLQRPPRARLPRQGRLGPCTAPPAAPPPPAVPLVHLSAWAPPGPVPHRLLQLAVVLAFSSARASGPGWCGWCTARGLSRSRSSPTVGIWAHPNAFTYGRLSTLQRTPHPPHYLSGRQSCLNQGTTTTPSFPRCGPASPTRGHNNDAIGGPQYSRLLPSPPHPSDSRLMSTTRTKTNPFPPCGPASPVRGARPIPTAQGGSGAPPGPYVGITTAAVRLPPAWCACQAAHTEYPTPRDRFMTHGHSL